MGNSFRCWVTGYTASEQNGPPALVSNYKEKGIREAINQANEYVEENYKDGFCTIGSDNFLKCWKLEKGCKAKFEKISKNVLLCYYYGYLSLDKETKAEIDNDNFSYTYLYY
jgi:hypothetical protein